MSLTRVYVQHGSLEYLYVDDDPTVTPGIYGRYHGQVMRVVCDSRIDFNDPKIPTVRMSEIDSNLQRKPIGDANGD